MARVRVTFEVDLPEVVLERTTDGALKRGFAEQYLFDVLFNQAICSCLDWRMRIATLEEMNPAVRAALDAHYERDHSVLVAIEKAVRVEYIQGDTDGNPQDPSSGL